MNKIVVVFILLGGVVSGRLIGDPALTIYNQNFAVVRDTVPLDLKAGVNDITYADTTAHLEPDSVILRDPSGKVNLQILEQNYRNDPVSQELLLSLFEGKTIDFIKDPNRPDVTVQGKIIRSGYAGHSQSTMQPYASRITNHSQARQRVSRSSRWAAKFSSGFRPADFSVARRRHDLETDAFVKLNADAAGKLDAEIAYITEGMSWHADYNVVCPGGRRLA